VADPRKPRYRKTSRRGHPRFGDPVTLGMPMMGRAAIGLCVCTHREAPRRWSVLGATLERQRLTSHRARFVAEKSLRGGHFAKSVGDVTGGTEVTKVGQMQTPLGHFVRRQRTPSPPTAADHRGQSTPRHWRGASGLVSSPAAAQLDAVAVIVMKSCRSCPNMAARGE